MLVRLGLVSLHRGSGLIFDVRRKFLSYSVSLLNYCPGFVRVEQIVLFLVLFVIFVIFNQDFRVLISLMSNFGMDLANAAWNVVIFN